MSTEHPFITEMRTNLNSFNEKAQQRAIRQRKARRKRIALRIGLYAVSLTVGLVVGNAIVNATEADAGSQTQVNRYIRAHGGIAPCTHEDGSGQHGPCYWDASARGNGKGYDYIAMPDGKDKDDDKDIVYLTGPKAVRY